MGPNSGYPSLPGQFVPL